MNIDRQSSGGVPRIDKSTVLFGRVSAAEDPLAGIDTAAATFSSVLAELDPEARQPPGPDVSELAATLVLPDPVRDLAVLTDPAIWLTQGMAVASGVGTDPDASLCRQPGVVPDPAVATDPPVWLAQTMTAALGTRPEPETRLARQSDPLVLPDQLQMAVPGGVGVPTATVESTVWTPPNRVIAGGDDVQPEAIKSGTLVAAMGATATMATTATPVSMATTGTTATMATVPTVAATATMAAEYFNVAATSVPNDPTVQPARRRTDTGQQLAPAVIVADTSAAAVRAELAAAAELNLKSDWRSASTAQAERMASSANPAQGEAAGGFKSLPGLGASERQAGRSLFVPLDGFAAGGGTPTVYSTNASPGPGALVVADAPFAAGSSGEVAQKVHYWITRGVQSAELQLDAFGGSAVDVSISMQGKEAQVEFRSDQPEARRMLQDAMPQLKDMLRSEGLELSGGYVGTSAHQDPHAKRDRADSQRSKMETVAVLARTNANAARPSIGQPHTLDIFV